MKKRKFLGIILIILGIAMLVSLLTFDTLHRYRLWSSNDSGKADEFSTFRAYLWDVSRGTVVLSFALGSIPGAIGIILLRKCS